MGFRTFLGPLLIGTQKWGSGRNTGLVPAVQIFNSGDLTGAVVGSVDTAAFVLPRGAAIMDITIDQSIAAGTGTTTVSVGTTSGGAELSAAVATSAGGRFRGTATAATMAQWVALATSTADTTVYVRNTVATGTLTAGRYVVTITYAVREGDQSAYPTQG